MLRTWDIILLLQKYRSRHGRCREQFSKLFFVAGCDESFNLCGIYFSYLEFYFIDKGRVKNAWFFHILKRAVYAIEVLKARLLFGYCCWCLELKMVNGVACPSPFVEHIWRTCYSLPYSFSPDLVLYFIEGGSWSRKKAHMHTHTFFDCSDEHIVNNFQSLCLFFVMNQ